MIVENMSVHLLFSTHSLKQHEVVLFLRSKYIHFFNIGYKVVGSGVKKHVTLPKFENR